MQSRHSTKQDLQHPSGHINSPYEQTLEKTPGQTFNNDELILEQISIRESFVTLRLRSLTSLRRSARRVSLLRMDRVIVRG